MEKHYIVYRTENKANNKFYYGVHNLNAANSKSYLGGGTALADAINKYGKDKFIRRTIMKFATPEEAYDFERLMVDMALVDNRDCYNLTLGGVIPKGFLGKKHSKEWINESIKRHTGVKFSSERKRKMSESLIGHKFNRNNVPVIDKLTGKSYWSINRMAKDLGLCKSTSRVKDNAIRQTNK